MSISDTGEVWGLLMQTPRREAADTERQESALTLSRYIVAPSQRTLRISLLLLLTSAAGWTDVLCYLAVGRVFASFMTGNILFVGISIAQGNRALLVRAVVAILLLFVGITLGSLYLQRLPARQTLEGWRRTLVRYLAVEGGVLLAFALLWSLVGNLAQRPTAQVGLLGVAAFAMGLQGALVGAFNIPSVVTVALTGTDGHTAGAADRQAIRRLADQSQGRVCRSSLRSCSRTRWPHSSSR